jgi:toxin YoeB
MYKIYLSDTAEKDMRFFAKNQPHNYKKALKLLEELMLHPKTGSGRPEQLKYELTGKWSRRIDDEHRMVYTIDEEVVVVEVLKMRYHYD